MIHIFIYTHLCDDVHILIITTPFPSIQMQEYIEAESITYQNYPKSHEQRFTNAVMCKVCVCLSACV